jgi:hypothetical protein
MVNKSRNMRLVEQVASMGEMRSAYRMLFQKPKRKSSLGRPRPVWIEFTWLRTRPVGSCCEHGNEPSGLIKGRKFLK